MKLVVVALLAVGGCWRAPPSPPAAPLPPRRAETCPSVIAGSLHDLDHGDEPLVAATIVFGTRTDGTDDRPTITDEHGTFIIEDLVQPQRHVEVYYADVIAMAQLPACVTKIMWIGIRSARSLVARALRSVRQGRRRQPR